MRGGEAVPVAVLTLVQPLGVDQPAPTPVRHVVDANVPPARLPTHHFSFAEAAEGVECFAFGPSGDVGFAQTSVRVIDVWPVVVARWPEIGGAVLVVLTLGAGLVSRRRLRFTTGVGKPLCRRCGYEVDQAQGLCPECGIDLRTRRPRIGRSRARRLAPVVVPVLALWVVYFVTLAIGVPRHGTVSTWTSWPSELASRWAQRHKLDIPSSIGCATYRLTWRESASSRRLHETRAFTGSWLACSPDGQFLLGDSGCIFDVATGERWYIPSAVLPGQAVPIGFADDPSAAIYQDGRDVYVLGLASRTSTRAAQLPSAARASCLALQPPQLISFERGEPVRTPLPNVEGLVPTPPRETFTYGDRSSTDGRFVIAWNLGAFRVRRLAAGSPGEHTDLQAGPDDSFTASFDLSLTGSLLAVATRRPAILVRDLEHSVWVAALALPPGYYGARPLFSPDNRWIAARVQTGDGRAKPFRHELLIWDLAQIRSTSEHAQPVSEASPP